MIGKHVVFIGKLSFLMYGEKASFQSKPWIRKVKTSRGHLLVEKRTILEKWYTSYILFRNKTFLFVKIESWNFKHLFDFGIHAMSSECCLNEQKFCEVSRNPKSNRWWNFQLSILTNKKVLFLKKYEVYQVSRIDRCRIVSQLSYLVYMAKHPILCKLAFYITAEFEGEKRKYF